METFPAVIRYWLLRACPKNNHFQSDPDPKLGWFGNPYFQECNQDPIHDLALGSERESTGLNQAEKFMFEYW